MMCRVESVVRGHGGYCQLSLAWVLKLASARHSLRNVTEARYLGIRVTLRLTECAGAGRTEGMVGRDLMERRGSVDMYECALDSCVGDGWSEDD